MLSFINLQDLTISTHVKLEGELMSLVRSEYKAKKKPRRETELLKIFHTFTNLFLSEKVGAQ